MSEPCCPECGAEVWGDLTCHTWPGGERKDGSIIWMACQGCASATHYWCDSDDCDWSYDYGLNPGNPRSSANEAKRPPWIPEGHDAESVLAGVKTWWAESDEGADS